MPRKDARNLSLTLTEVVRQSNGNHLLKARSGGFVLDVELSKMWPGSRTGEGKEMPVRSGIVRFLSAGKGSDGFLAALAKLYDVPMPSAMAKATEFEGISIEGDPGNPKDGSVRIKLFYHVSGGDVYAEAYLEFDAAAKTLTLAEKDPQFRGPLVEALSRG